MTLLGTAHSQTTEYDKTTVSFLTIPDGPYKGRKLNATVLKKMIPTQLDNVSEVYDISIRSLHLFDPFFRPGGFFISFTVKTTAHADPPDEIYEYVGCTSWIQTRSNGDREPKLILVNCANGQIQFKKIELPLTHILQKRSL